MYTYASILLLTLKDNHVTLETEKRTSNSHHPNRPSGNLIYSFILLVFSNPSFLNLS